MQFLRESLVTPLGEDGASAHTHAFVATLPRIASPWPCGLFLTKCVFLCPLSQTHYCLPLLERQLRILPSLTFLGLSPLTPDPSLPRRQLAVPTPVISMPADGGDVFSIFLLLCALFLGEVKFGQFGGKTKINSWKFWFLKKQPL